MSRYVGGFVNYFFGNLDREFIYVRALDSGTANSVIFSMYSVI